MPGSRLDVFRGAGHFPHRDDPMRFLRVLEDFVGIRDIVRLVEQFVETGERKFGAAHGARDAIQHAIDEGAGFPPTIAFGQRDRLAERDIERHIGRIENFRRAQEIGRAHV